MTDDIRFEREARDWLQLGPVQAPADVVQAAFFEIDTTPQERGLRVSWRISPPVRYAIGATAAAVVLAAAVGLVPLLGLREPPVETQLHPASATITFAPTWPQDDRVAATVQGAGLDEVAYWLGATFDHMTSSSWSQADARTVTRPAGGSLLDGAIDEPSTEPPAKVVTLTVTPASSAIGPFLVSPGLPVAVDQPVKLTLLGSAGFFGAIELDDPAGSPSYRITAGVSARLTAAGGPDVTALRAAGTRYPAEVAQRYLQLDPGTLGPNATALRDRIVADARSRAPVDLAQAAEAVLRSSAFTYSVDVRDLDCGAMSIAECFATYRRGYCLHYATTMAAILRDLGVPTRLVQGFLPGTVSGDVEVIRARDAHAWVEVYFPGYGWVAFDPTGGSRPGQAVPLP